MEQKFITDKQGNRILPITHIDAVRDSNGNTLTSKLGTAAGKDVPSSGNASSTQVVMGNDTRLTDSRLANGGNSSTVNGHTVLSDVPANAVFTDSDTHHDGSVTATSGYALTKVQVASNGTWSKEEIAIPTKSSLLLNNVDNTSDATKKSNFTGSIASGNTGFVTGEAAYSALAGKADLVDGVIPESQLPSYVDDVVELLAVSGTAPATCAKGDLYYNISTKKIVRATAANTWGTGATTNTDPESGKIYINIADSKTYRWGGSSSGLVVISETLALGETSGTAYRGDRGKTAYDHSQSTHARTDATKTEASSTNGNIKINGSETTVYTHPTSTAASAAAVKVGNDAQGHVVIGNALTAGDVSAVSTVASQGLSNTQKSNARTNIGAGTYSKPSGGIPASDLADDAKEHEYVDLGLPSGLLWAVDYYNRTNLANHPYVYADQVASYYQYGDNLLDDWGQGWRVPNNEEIEELISTSNVTISLSSNEHYTITSKTNGNTLALSPVGTPPSDYVGHGVCIWSSSVFGGSSDSKYYYIQLYGQIPNYSWISNVNYGTNKEALVLLVHDPFPVSPAKVKDSLGISSSGSATKYLNEKGNFTTIASDSSKQDKITASGLLKGNGSGTVSAAVAGTDYQAPLVFNTAYNASSNKVATMADIPSSLPANGGAALTSQHIIAGNQIFNGLPNKGVGMTVSQVRDAIKNYFANYAEGIGSNIYVSTDAIYNWTDLTHTVIDSSVYCFIKVGGGYQGSAYGQFLLSSYDTYPLYYCGLNSGVWSPMVKISSDSDLSSYLPLNGGGTITNGSVTISSGADSKLILNDTNGEGHSYINFSNNGTSIGNFGLFGDSYLRWSGKRIVVRQYETPTTSNAYTIYPNIDYCLNTISQATTFTLGPLEQFGSSNEYMLQFDMGSTAYTIDGLSASIIWQGGVPSFEANKHYEISIKYDPVGQRYFGLCSSFNLT